MQDLFKEYINKLSDKYPNAKVIEADDPEIEDDSIELTAALHIQVHSDWKYGTVVEEIEEGTFKFHDTKTLDAAVTEANEMV